MVRQPAVKAGQRRGGDWQVEFLGLQTKTRRVQIGTRRVFVDEGRHAAAAVKVMMEGSQAPIPPSSPENSVKPGELRQQVRQAINHCNFYHILIFDGLDGLDGGFIRRHI